MVFSDEIDRLLSGDAPVGYGNEDTPVKDLSEKEVAEVAEVVKKRGRTRKVNKETVAGSVNKKTGVNKETGERKKTVAESRGMTPEELIQRRGIPNEVYKNNYLQAIGGSGEENANTRFIKKNLEIASLPEIDLNDAAQVRERIAEYFMIEARYGNKPTVAGLGMSLNGMDRRRLYEIKTGNFGNVGGYTTKLPKSVMDEVKKAYRMMEQLWEDYMQNGRINPVAGIFLGKNNYGYQDKTEYVVTPNQQRETEFSEAEMRRRYGLPPADSDSQSDSLSDSQSDSD